MNIYFAGSIRGSAGNKETYAAFIAHLRKYGSVLTEHVASKNILELEKDITDESIFEQDLAWLKACDAVIADVSVPSLGVGWEIATAEALGKKVLCIHQKPEKGKAISAMIKGNKALTVKEYGSLQEALQHIDNFLT